MSGFLINFFFFKKILFQEAQISMKSFEIQVIFQSIPEWNFLQKLSEKEKMNSKLRSVLQYFFLHPS